MPTGPRPCRPFTCRQEASHAKPASHCRPCVSGRSRVYSVNHISWRACMPPSSVGQSAFFFSEKSVSVEPDGPGHWVQDQPSTAVRSTYYTSSCHQQEVEFKQSQSQILLYSSRRWTHAGLRRPWPMAWRLPVLRWPAGATVYLTEQHACMHIKGDMEMCTCM